MLVHMDSILYLFARLTEQSVATVLHDAIGLTCTAMQLLSHVPNSTASLSLES